jgi:hypothetical protein
VRDSVPRELDDDVSVGDERRLRTAATLVLVEMTAAPDLPEPDASVAYDGSAQTLSP